MAFNTSKKTEASFRRKDMNDRGTISQNRRKCNFMHSLRANRRPVELTFKWVFPWIIEIICKLLWRKSVQRRAEAKAEAEADKRPQPNHNSSTDAIRFLSTCIGIQMHTLFAPATFRAWAWKSRKKWCDGHFEAYHFETLLQFQYHWFTLFFKLPYMHMSHMIRSALAVWQLWEKFGNESEKRANGFL